MKIDSRFDGQGTTSQLAEKLVWTRFVTGHDFSRAAKAAKSTWALAPAQFRPMAPQTDFQP
jgi:hypothetical protein